MSDYLDSLLSAHLSTRRFEYLKLPTAYCLLPTVF
jgi:hypothetical protein